VACSASCRVMRLGVNGSASHIVEPLGSLDLLG
jgi:hypothetical protein